MEPSLPEKRHSEYEWQKHKQVIRRLVIEERMPLPETRRRLEDDGFKVTKAQLEYRLKLWGFRQRMTKGAWQFVEYHVKKRNKQGKRSQVMHNGQIVDAAKVRKNTNRYQETALVRFTQPVTSPKAPDGLEISIFTPDSLPVSLSWPGSLPWLLYQNNSSIASSPFSLREKINNISKDSESRKELLGSERLLQSLVSRRANNISVVRLAAEISSMMPESHEYENLTRASQLIQGSADERHQQAAQIILYRLSNNLVPDMTGDGWDFICEMLEESGIMKIPLKLTVRTDVTLRAVAEQLFQHSILQLGYDVDKEFPIADIALEACREGRIIDWLLKSGQDADTPIPCEGDEDEPTTCSPLHHALWMRSPELMLRLLDYKASPNPPHSSLGSILSDIIRNYSDLGDGRLRVVERLLEMGARVDTDEIVRRMLDHSFDYQRVRGAPNMELLQALIRGGVDIFHEIQAGTACVYTLFWDPFSIVGYTALFRCAPNEVHPVFQLLGYAGIRNISQFPRSFDTTGVVMMAASQGNTDLLDDLCRYGINITALSSHGFSALHVAAYNGHFETCQRMVWKYKVPVDICGFTKQIPSALHLAAWRGCISVVKFLCENKADVNIVEELEESTKFFRLDYQDSEHPGCARSPVGTALVSRHYGVARHLFECGAKAPVWAAYLASHAGQTELQKLALKAGADPNWTHPKYGGPIHTQFMSLGRSAQQQLLLRVHDNDLWSCKQMSILEAAFQTRDGDVIEKIFGQKPSAYDPGALCARIFYSSTSKHSVSVDRLLQNRPQSQKTSVLEALAVGIAAGTGQMETLELLVAKFSSSQLAPIPRNASRTLMHFYGHSIWLYTCQEFPFWNEYCRFPVSYRGFAHVSPTLFGLRFKESLPLMLDHGYRPDRPTMCKAIMNNDFDVMRLLLKYPRLSNDLDGDGPFSFAVRHKKYEVVQILLANGEDVNEDNYHVPHGRSPLQSAIENCDLDMIDLLLEHNAEANAPAAYNRGATALQLAAITGQIGVISILVGLEADINAAGAVVQGRTALEGAAEHGRIDILQYLLTGGIQTRGTGQLQYLRAIRYAQLEGHIVSVDLLKSHREWTAEDNGLWAALEVLSKEDCETFGQEMSSEGDDSEEDGSEEDCTPVTRDFSSQGHGNGSIISHATHDDWGQRLAQEAAEEFLTSYMDIDGLEDR